MSYPSRYYAMQRQTLADIGYATRTGLCPVCKVRPSATWPSGVKRITCGDQACFLRWLPGAGEPYPRPAAPPPTVVVEPSQDRGPAALRSALGRLWLHVGPRWFLPATTVTDAAGRGWIAANVGVFFEEMAPGYLVRFRPGVAGRLATIHASRTFYRRSKTEIDQMWAALLSEANSPEGSGDEG